MLRSWPRSSSMTQAGFTPPPYQRFGAFIVPAGLWRSLLPNLIRRGRPCSRWRNFRWCWCRFLLRGGFGQFVIYFGSFDWMNAVIVGVRLGQLALPLQQRIEAF